MRILNRPMFRYGGPIKEGVMHGMRNGGRAALVGNPVYPRTGGREHHKSVSMLNPMNWKNIFVGANVAKNPTIGSKAWQGLQKLFGTTTPVRHTPVTPVAGGTMKNTWGINTATKPSWKAGKEVTTNIFSPNWLGRTSEAQLAQKLWQGKGFIGKPIKAGAQFLYRTPTASIPLVYFGGKWLLKDGTPAPDQDKINKQVAGAGDKWDPGAGADQYDPSTSPSALAAAAKKARTEKLSKYLDMMGYDRAKKTAMSDALIDASAIVQQGTEEGGSLKHADWSKMINQAIQTTSKRYDKPEQIREAVGLMMTKGAIDKDIASGKQSEAEKTMELLGITPAEYKKKFLDQKSFRENVALFSKTLQGQEAFDSAAQSTPGVDFKGNLINSTDWTKSLKAMKKDPDSVGLNEKQLIELYTEKEIAGKGYQDGDYTVGDNLVTIKDSLVIGVR
jgi:hypothetical protein